MLSKPVIIFSAISTTIIFLLSCKKERQLGSGADQDLSPSTGTRTELTLDSIFLYARQVYLWNDAITNYQIFSPRDSYRHLNPEITAFRQELYELSQLKINPVTGKPYEKTSEGVAKYSYLDFGRTYGSRKASNPDSGGQFVNKMDILIDKETVAYVSLSAFPDLTSSRNALDYIFENIRQQQCRSLILDLRSNSGGYVETAEYLANLIAPSSLNNKIMYSEQFNQTLQQGKGHILKYQPYLDEKGQTVTINGRLATMADVDFSERNNTYKFHKTKGPESIANILFITSNRTASASEMLINTLRPYFNTKIIGETTYGKPVGFFPIVIDRYTVFLSSFLIKNAHGSADYFNGISPEIYVDIQAGYRFGDLEEPGLRTAIAQVRFFQASGNRAIAQSFKASGKTSIKLITDVQGSIETRLKLSLPSRH